MLTALVPLVGVPMFLGLIVLEMREHPGMDPSMVPRVTVAGLGLYCLGLAFLVSALVFGY